MNIKKIINDTVQTFKFGRQEFKAYTEENLPKIAEALDNMEWELLAEDGDIKLYRGNTELEDISVAGSFEWYVPAKITDGTNTIQFWVYDGEQYAFYDSINRVIVLNTEIMEYESARTIMGILLHEDFHRKHRPTRMNTAQFFYFSIIRTTTPFMYIRKLEEFRADHNTAKNGYGPEMAEWLTDNMCDEVGDYDNVYLSLLRSNVDHPPTMLRTLLLNR